MLTCGRFHIRTFINAREAKKFSSTMQTVPKPAHVFTLLTANETAYQHLKNEVMYPICYIGAEVPIWKEIMGFQSENVC
jgi:hypothetical protein